MQKQILHLDSDVTVTEETKQILNTNGFEVISCSSLGEALAALAVAPVQIILTEIHIEGSEPGRVIEALRKQRPDAVVLILTSQPERRTGPDRRLGHIFEFITKPVPAAALVGHLRRAFAFYEEKLKETRVNAESEERLRARLEWLIWKHQTKLSVLENYLSLINNVKFSLAQGAGVEVLCNLIELIEVSAEKKDGKIEVPADVYESLLHSARSAQTWMEGLDRMAGILKLVSRQKADPIEVLPCVQSAAAAVEALRKVKNHRLQVEGIPDAQVNLPRYLFELVLRELLTNAFKYSPERSTVNVTAHRAGNSLSVSVLNDILPVRGGLEGVPSQYEHTVFEPFFRLNNSYDERFRNEELGLGFGLPIVAHVLTTFSGKIDLYETTDYSQDLTPRRRIVAEVVLAMAG